MSEAIRDCAEKKRATYVVFERVPRLKTRDCGGLTMSVGGSSRTVPKPENKGTHKDEGDQVDESVTNTDSVSTHTRPDPNTHTYDVNAPVATANMSSRFKSTSMRRGRLRGSACDHDLNLVRW